MSSNGDKISSKIIKSTSAGRTLYDVARIGDSGYVAVGVENYPAAAMARSDPWGNISCAESGKCAALIRTGCADGKDCTIDSCVGASGCSYANNMLLGTTNS